MISDRVYLTCSTSKGKLLRHAGISSGLMQMQSLKKTVLCNHVLVNFPHAY
ncbi:hypothetical protein COCHEDRAFT_1021467 [Bipolaris maydis C5]|uniref:Uncharacterized protein n=1 Tax=Cochliobolus heterostrophus (strain C5 / ATCC 48332 / race O) TaxID=701091 RepID=M2TYW3_COCH5|nr:hypothetical protein COCHEDRAFT_1021467 [Bipolaris maydis C5]